jgi:hypothetical protein
MFLIRLILQWLLLIRRFLFDGFGLLLHPHHLDPRQYGKACRLRDPQAQYERVVPNSDYLCTMYENGLLIGLS